MYADIIVTLLEEHLDEMEKRLGAPFWEDFVNTLEKYSENLIPKRNELEEWAEKISGLLSNYDYSKGLLQGVLFCESLGKRGILTASEVLKPVEMPETPSARIPPDRSHEDDLIERIKKIMQRARRSN
jgi:hypothetical protein